MRDEGLYPCLGGPYDGTSPPWADGRDRFYVPVAPDLTINDAPYVMPSRTNVETDTYYLVRLRDGRMVYLWQDSYRAARATSAGPCRP